MDLLSLALALKAAQKGSGGGGGGNVEIFDVTVDTSVYPATLSAPYAEIAAAIEAGKIPVLRTGANTPVDPLAVLYFYYSGANSDDEGWYFVFTSHQKAWGSIKLLVLEVDQYDNVVYREIILDS